MVQDTGGDAPEGNAQAGDAPVPAAAPGLGAGSAAAAHTGVVPAGPARGGLGALRSLVHSLAWLLGLAVALLLLAVLVWRGAGWWVDWRGPTPAQQAALALINAQDLALPGPDGFADLWLLDKDVPPEQRAAWLAQDVAWFKQQHLFAPLAGLPSKQLPDLPLGQGKDLSCQHNAPCLDHVRAQYEAVSQWAERQAPLLDRVEALASAGHWGRPFGNRLDAPLPRHAHLARLYTRFALRFVQAQRKHDAAQAKADNPLDDLLAASEQADSEQFAAMQGLCRHTAAMQRLLTQPGQTLMAQLLASAHVRQSTRLLADMLAERAPEQPTPAACAQAFAPQDGQPPALGVGTQASAAMCHGLRAEWQLLRSFEGLQPGWPWQYEGEVGEWLMVALTQGNPRATEALGAQARAAYCTPHYAQAYAQGDRAALQTPAPQFDTLSCVASPLACSQLGDMSFTTLADSLHDREAMRRAMAGLLYTRALLEGGPTDQDLAYAKRRARWEARPARLHMPGADAQWVEQPHRMLRVKLWAGEGAWFELPL